MNLSPKENSIMASRQYNCETELSITDIEQGENEEMASGICFVDIRDILNREIKKESTESNPLSEYGVSNNESLEKNGNDKCYDPNSSEFEVMLRKSGKDSEESNFPATQLLETNHINNEDLLNNEDEDPFECIDDSSTNNIELKTETLKTEDNVSYEDVKPEIWVKESGENATYSNSVADILIGPNFSHEFSIDSETWPQQNIEDGTAEERDGGTRKNCQMTQNIPNCEYDSKLYPFESEHKINSRKKSYQCNICSKSFTVKHNLLQHERSHTGEKPFQCTICLKSYVRRNNLILHDKIHRGEKPFKCKFCPKSFPRKASLLVHEGIHDIVEKPFQCKVCSKSFAVKSSLWRHERIHTVEKSFQCKICSQSFILKANLTTHERVHTGEKPFQCKFCPKSFALKNTLLLHERTHTGEKPFQCRFCPKSFAVKVPLVHHERIHTGEKPFQCKFCSKTFSQKTNLTIHERIHTGEKPFQCKICEKSFNTKASLTIHERIHTGERPFQCKFCTRCFIIKSNMLLHEKTHKGRKNRSKSSALKEPSKLHDNIHTGVEPTKDKLLESKSYVDSFAEFIQEKTPLS